MGLRGVKDYINIRGMAEGRGFEPLPLPTVLLFNSKLVSLYPTKTMRLQQ